MTFNGEKIVAEPQLIFDPPRAYIFLAAGIKIEGQQDTLLSLHFYPFFLQDEAEGIVAMLLGEVIHLVGNFGEIQELNASEFSHGRCTMTFQFIVMEGTFIPK